MKRENVDYICSLYGYLIRLQEIHWNTNYNSAHMLCDEIYDLIKDNMDRFAECAQGIENTHFKIGDLKPMLPNATNLKGMIEELSKETHGLRRTLDKAEENTGLVNILDDILEACGKYSYRSTQVGGHDA